MYRRIPVGVGAVFCVFACSGSGDDDTTIMTSPDAGTSVVSDAGTPDAGPPDSGIGPCGLYGHEDPGGTCTSSVAWTPGPAIPGARDHHATTIYEFADGPYLLISGGGQDSFMRFYDDIIRMKLDERGRPASTWEQIGTIPAQMAGHTMLVTGNYVYVIGGANRSGRFSTVVSAAIAPDGRMGDWRTEPRIPVGVWHHQTFVRDGFIYVIGGQSGNEVAEEGVHRAAINADGSLADWESLTPLPAVRSHHGAIPAKDAIFVLGGLEDSEFRAEVLRATFTATGTISDWENVGLIPGDGLVTPSVGLIGDTIFVIAGLTGSLEFVGTVFSMQILEDGTVTPLAETPSPLPEGRGHVHQLPDLNGNLYIAGGRSGDRVGVGFRSLDTFFYGRVR